jgi:hypothetical protein
MTWVRASINWGHNNRADQSLLPAVKGSARASTVFVSRESQATPAPLSVRATLACHANGRLSSSAAFACAGGFERVAAGVSNATPRPGGQSPRTPGQGPGPSPGMNSPQDSSCPGSVRRSCGPVAELAVRAGRKPCASRHPIGASPAARAPPSASPRAGVQRQLCVVNERRLPRLEPRSDPTWGNRKPVQLHRDEQLAQRRRQPHRKRFGGVDPAAGRQRSFDRGEAGGPQSRRQRPAHRLQRPVEVGQCMFDD